MASRNNPLKRLEDALVYQFFRFLSFLARRISRRQFELLASQIGDLLFRAFRLRRTLVLENLSKAFPGKSEHEVYHIARQCYRNMAVNLLEVLRIPLLKTQDDARRLMQVDEKHVKKFFKVWRSKGKGAVVISAHFGNWELAGVCLGLMGISMSVVAKRLRNRYIDREINALRSFHGNGVLYKKQALREGLRILSQGGVLTILGDQSDPSGGFVTKFLGRPASVFLGPAFLALKAGSPVFVAMSRRLINGQYLLEIEQVPTADLTFSRHDIQILTQRYTRVIESWVIRYPEEWFWVHDRWKRHEK